MRLMAVALLVGAVAMAGCTDNEPANFSRERMVISINDIGGGYAIGLPLWLADDGALPEDWLNVARVFGGNATLSIRLVGGAPTLWVEGEGDATINANDLTSSRTAASPEAYLGGAHSLGTNAAGLPLAHVERGDVDITWQYEGTSQDCALFLNHGWTNVQAGTHVSDYGKRPDRQFDCVR